jgi:hypothetical protein
MNLRNQQIISAVCTLKHKQVARKKVLQRLASKRRTFPFPQITYYLAIGQVPRSLWDN